MKICFNFLKRSRFLFLLFLFFLLFDFTISTLCPPYFARGHFWLNDFEITQRDHPDAVWDKVFFGNSTVIASYREDLSESGYINLGIDYGVVKDLWEMIDKDYIEIGSELVIGLNWLTLYDHFETNPSYIWHRGVLEPYSYFQRDKLKQMLTENFNYFLKGTAIEPIYQGQTKSYYYGCLSDAALAEKAEQYTETYWNVPMADFSENLVALEHIIDYCEKHDILLRVVWMPWNPSVEKPDIVESVHDTVDHLCKDHNIETLNLMDTLDETCFYDIGHLNYEYGSYVFMEVVEKWLLS